MKIYYNQRQNLFIIMLNEEISLKLKKKDFGAVRALWRHIRGIWFFSTICNEKEMGVKNHSKSHNVIYWWPLMLYVIAENQHEAVTSIYNNICSHLLQLSVTGSAGYSLKSLWTLSIIENS